MKTGKVANAIYNCWAIFFETPFTEKGQIEIESDDERMPEYNGMVLYDCLKTAAAYIGLFMKFY